MTRQIPGQQVEGFDAPVYNENEVRAAAGLTLAAGSIAFCYAYFEKEFVPIKVVATFFFVEFLIRVFVGFQYSPTGLVSKLLIGRRDPEWVSAKPKRFAWTMGLVLSGAMTVITNSNITGVLPRTICLICVVLMWLEAVLGFCVGCQLYGLMVRRGWIEPDAAFEVCADGSCEIPQLHPVGAAQAPRELDWQPTDA
jgi:hypothetical protein